MVEAKTTVLREGPVSTWRSLVIGGLSLVVAGCGEASAWSGPWMATIGRDAHVVLAFDGDASGMLEWQQTMGDSRTGCVQHIDARGEFTRTGVTAGDIHIVLTEGEWWVDGCAELTSDRPAMPASASELASGNIDGTYALEDDSLVITFELDGFDPQQYFFRRT